MKIIFNNRSDRNLSATLTRLVCFLSSLIFLSGCVRQDKYYYIDELGVYISINDVDVKNDMYKVGIVSLHDTLINDYLYVRIPSTDMPVISLYFPVDKPDTIYVLDRWTNVKRINSSKYNFILYNNKPRTVESSSRYIHIRDSIQKHIKAVGIAVYLHGVSIWDENKENRGIFDLPW